MLKGASAHARRSSRRKGIEAAAVNPPAPTPLGQIVRLQPTHLLIESPTLVDPVAEAMAREFLCRAFGVGEVDAVTFRRKAGQIDVRLNAAATTAAVWAKVAAALRGVLPGDAENRARLARRVATLSLAEPVAEATVQVSRHGDALTTWRVSQSADDRLLFSHPALRRRRDVLHGLRTALSSIHGVETLTINALTGRVRVRFDPQLIDASRLVIAFEESWRSVLTQVAPPLSPRRLVAASGLLGLALAARYLRPALRPLALIGVTLYALPNLLQAARQLSRGEVGLPMLYSVGLAFMLWSGMPLSSTVMAVFMQSWPHLSQRLVFGCDYRLFGNSRRRFVWARLRQDGVERRIDLDCLSAGDVIHLRTGDYIPVDGVVAEGLGAVDEDMLTGVLGAIDKVPGDRVYASTFLRAGSLAVRVARKAGQSSVSVVSAALPVGPIINLPSSAEAERIANRNAKPALALAALTFALTRIPRMSQVIIRPDYATAPRLSAQLSAITGIAEALRQGILLRTPNALDRLLGANLYVFDDSAGLDRPQVAVAAIISAEDDEQVLRLATTAFARRGDARAAALRKASAQRRIVLPDTFRRRRVAGAIRFEDESGVEVEVATTLYVNHMELAVPQNLAQALAEAKIASHPKQDPSDPDLRPLWIARAGKIIGAVAFKRSAPFGRSVVETLQARNPKARFVYLAKSRQKSARAVAMRAGIETVIADLDASAKAETIRELSRRAIWVGNGTARGVQPSIAASAISISVGGVATLLDDAADVVLLQSDLDGLLTVRQLAQAHLGRLRSDYRKVYVANVLAAAGAFVTGFAGLQAGLLSNLGTALVFAARCSDLRCLAQASERRDVIRLSAPTEELEAELFGQDSQVVDQEILQSFPDVIDHPSSSGGV